MNLEEHLKRHIAFSRATFGPGPRTNGITDHIRKELIAVEATEKPENWPSYQGWFGRAEKWVDVVILALDGLTRELAASEDHPRMAAHAACRMILEKQDRNELRDWPDWRTQSQDRAIEHERSPR